MKMLNILIEFKSIRILILILTVLVFSTCVRRNKAITESSWIVDTVKAHADSVLLFASSTDFVTLHFQGSQRGIQRGNEAVLHLNPNFCSSNVKFVSENRIEFSGFGCSLICCDSHLASLVPTILADVDIYTLNEKILTMATKDGRVVNFVKM